MVLGCTFVLGAVITELKLGEYFSDLQTYEYLLNALLILRHELPGVFHCNVYGATVNGALWTLPVEFCCYIGVSLLWKLGVLEERAMKYTIPLCAVGYYILHILLKKAPVFMHALLPCGMFYDIYRKNIHINMQNIGLCILGLIVSVYCNLLEYGILFFLPYILIYIVFGTKNKWAGFGKKHEMSYEMYLCAFPIQRIITMLFGGRMHPMLNFGLSMPIILLVGWILNVFVEKRLKRYFI